MKKISILLVAVLMVITTTYSQKDAAVAAAGVLAPTGEQTDGWKYEAGLGLFANQVALVNWAAGGVSTIAGVAKGEFSAKYRKGKTSWENEFAGEWGMIKEKSTDLRKNEDALKITSKYGYQIDKKGKMFVGALLNFNSQFTKGYTEGATAYSSNFLAPANMIIALGIDWKPSSDFSVFVSPIASKMTFVNDKNVDETTYGLKDSTTFKSEVGAYLKSEYKKDLMKNVKFKTALVLYTNYLDENFGNVDVDWITGIDMTVNKWITLKLGTQLIYDHDVKINVFDDNGVVEKTGPRTQFKEALNLGFTYKFVPKEKK